MMRYLPFALAATLASCGSPAHEGNYTFKYSKIYADTNGQEFIRTYDKEDKVMIWWLLDSKNTWVPSSSSPAGLKDLEEVIPLEHGRPTPIENILVDMPGMDNEEINTLTELEDAKNADYP